MDDDGKIDGTLFRPDIRIGPIGRLVRLRALKHDDEDVALIIHDKAFSQGGGKKKPNDNNEREEERAGLFALSVKARFLFARVEL